MSENKLTTIAIRPETKARLDRRRLERESYDEALDRLLEETLPRQFSSLEELKEKREEEYIPLDEVIEKLGL